MIANRIEKRYRDQRGGEFLLRSLICYIDLDLMQARASVTYAEGTAKRAGYMMNDGLRPRPDPDPLSYTNKPSQSSRPMSSSEPGPALLQCSEATPPRICWSGSSLVSALASKWPTLALLRADPPHLFPGATGPIDKVWAIDPRLGAPVLTELGAAVCVRGTAMLP